MMDQILSLLSGARDQALILIDTSRVLNLLSHNGNSFHFFFPFCFVSVSTLANTLYWIDKSDLLESEVYLVLIVSIMHAIKRLKVERVLGHQ